VLLPLDLLTVIPLPVTCRALCLAVNMARMNDASLPDIELASRFITFTLLAFNVPVVILLALMSLIIALVIQAFRAASLSVAKLVLNSVLNKAASALI